MTQVLVRDLADDVWTIIAAIPNLNTWRNEILDDNGQPVDPPADPDGRSHPYVVAYFDGGQRTSNRACASPNRLGWRVRVACVGGDDVRCLWAVDQVRAALTGLRLGGGILVELNPSTPLARVDGVQPSRTSTLLELGLYLPG